MNGENKEFIGKKRLFCFEPETRVQLKAKPKMKRRVTIQTLIIQICFHRRFFNEKKFIVFIKKTRNVQKRENGIVDVTELCMLQLSEKFSQITTNRFEFARVKKSFIDSLIFEN